MMTETLDGVFNQHRRSLTFNSPLSLQQELAVHRFSGREAISELFRFNVELLSQDARIELKTLIGKKVSLGIRLNDGSLRYISAHVSSFAHSSADDRIGRYQAELVPWLWMLSRRHDSRIFQDKNTEQIIAEVFSYYSTWADYEFRLNNPLNLISYCTQYQETDLDFVLRLLESAGLFFTFEHSETGHRLIIGDDSDRLAPLLRQPVIRYHRASVTEAEDSITAWSSSRYFQPTRLALKTFDYKQPRYHNQVQLKSINEQGDVGQLEVYEYEGLYGYTSVEDGEQKVRHRLEAMEVQGKVFSGRSNCRAMEPGYYFELTQHYDHDHDTPENRRFLLLAVDHWAQNNHQGEATYHNSFTCMRQKIPFRPSLRAPRKSISGPQTAIVVGPPGEEIFTDELGRVKVQFHWDRIGDFNERSSCWVRVAQASASNGFGSIWIPRIGDEVVVMFLDGNPDRPLIHGSVYNSHNPPPWALPANKTQSGVLTRSINGDSDTANFLRFEDKPGAEQIALHAERNLDTVVEADERYNVGGNSTLQVKGKRAETIRLESTVVVEEGDYLVTAVQGCVKVKAAKSIVLEVGASKLVMNADGTITLAGVVVDVEGTSRINLNK